MISREEHLARLLAEANLEIELWQRRWEFAKQAAPMLFEVAEKMDEGTPI